MSAQTLSQREKRGRLVTYCTSVTYLVAGLKNISRDYRKEPFGFPFLEALDINCVMS